MFSEKIVLNPSLIIRHHYNHYYSFTFIYSIFKELFNLFTTFFAIPSRRIFISASPRTNFIYASSFIFIRSIKISIRFPSLIVKFAFSPLFTDAILKSTWYLATVFFISFLFNFFISPLNFWLI